MTKPIKGKIKMTKQHALLSPSKANNWKDCAACAVVSAYSRSFTSTAADRGTSLHKIVADYLTSKRRPTLEEVLSEGLTETDFEIVSALIDSLSEKIPPDAVLSVEEKVIFSNVLGVDDKYAFGTLDLSYIEGDTLHVVDFKFGKVRVSAKDNYQLLLYAAGVLQAATRIGSAICSVSSYLSADLQAYFSKKIASLSSQLKGRAGQFYTKVYYSLLAASDIKVPLYLASFPSSQEEHKKAEEYVKKTLDLAERLLQVKKIKMQIYQANVSIYDNRAVDIVRREWSLTCSEVWEKASQLSDQAKKIVGIYEGYNCLSEDDFNKDCKHCSAKGIFNLFLGERAGEAIKILPFYDIAEALRQIPHLKKFIADVEEQAMTLFKSGGGIAGFELRDGVRKPLKWKTTDVELLTEQIPTVDVTETKLKSPATVLKELMKVMNGEEANNLINNLTYRDPSNKQIAETEFSEKELIF